MSTALIDRPEAWTLTESAPQPEQQRHWVHGWSAAPVRIRGLEHLIVLLTTLSPDNDHAGITDDVTERWAQVKRLGDLWWVEGRSETAGWPDVFVPEGWLAHTGHRSMDDHACWRHTVAAELVWAFLDGRALAGAVRFPAPGGEA